MSISKARKVLVLVSELSQVVHNVYELSADDPESVAHDDNVGVISDIAGSSTEVDDTCCIRTNLTVCENVSHNIMACDLFAFSRHFIVYIVDMLFELLYLCLGYRQTKFHFSSCESDPELSPGGEFFIRRENILHFLACITCTEWAFIAVDITAHFQKFSFITNIVLHTVHQINYSILHLSCQ